MPVGQDLRDVGIGDGGEAVVDGAGRCRVFLFRDFAQRHDEGEGAVLLYFRLRAKSPGLTPPKLRATRLAKPRA